MNKEVINSWGMDEFNNLALGDKRLTDRLIRVIDSLTNTPESTINQACGSWAETKAAYRFFQNENVKESEILSAHIAKTVERIKNNDTVLVIQDTSYIKYTSHKKTTGLGVLTRRGADRKETKGLVMHTAFVVSLNGLVLGILDQNINARPISSRKLKKSSHNNAAVPIEDKESIKWLSSLKTTVNSTISTGSQVVTVCDREADIYDFFECAKMHNTSILVRAAQDREVNKKSRYCTKDKKKLWRLVEDFKCSGRMTIEVPSRDNKPKRLAHLEVRFGKFMMAPPINSVRHKTQRLPSLPMYAIQVIEKNKSLDTTLLEWMLLTNIAVNNFEEAVEKIKWYCMRWKIEIFHKILKSGLRVEECRLSTGKRLTRYLTVMSIIAWRIFFITLIARSRPDLPCSILFTEEEWQVLYVKIHKTAPPNNAIPKIKDAILWVARLGGHLARKNDPEPGPIVIWKGWQRLFDLTQGWKLANSSNICG